MQTYSCLVEYKSLNKFVKFEAENKEHFIKKLRQKIEKAMGLVANANGQYPYQIRMVKKC